MNVEEKYINWQTLDLAKQHGYDWEPFVPINLCDIIIDAETSDVTIDFKIQTTHSMLQRWFREVHNIFIYIKISGNKNNWYSSVIKTKNKKNSKWEIVYKSIGSESYETELENAFIHILTCIL